ncbi:nucleoside-diphosphate-sugar epimerase [Talaromyces proteolyticus]|uniref:Nucleoside-diphosphate-sugar epimerase n=1 Tax=Talaromyces proteolyticus TaxID=1131652 RepID=A0AAD4L536_9EURO|nr:nucleoside-diphosphate-sugar epimerase [Talaromyces proteolyticus]KAH8703722.1 nucleoside-diphosphate-sugar epimerase [Talaromyces proteolyticus]
MNIILTGATGLVGTAALSHILSLPAGKISHLYILSRSPVPLAENHPNITVIQHSDFTNYSPDLLHKLKGAHGCIWALGVSQTQVSKEEYVRITVDYPLAAAKAFAGLNDSFNFVYVSGEGATSDPGIFTPFFGRVKGNCETALIELSKKYPSLKPYSVRPAFVDATHDPKVKDAVLQRPDQQTFVKRVLRNGVVSIVRATWSDVISPTKELGLFLTNLAGGDGKPLSEQGVSGDGWIISNIAIRKSVGI